MTLLTPNEDYACKVNKKSENHKKNSFNCCNFALTNIIYTFIYLWKIKISILP